MSNNERAAQIAAMADCIAILAYALDLSPVPFQAFGLVMKIVAMIYYKPDHRVAVKTALPLIACVTALSITSTISGHSALLVGLARNLAFCLGLYFTLCCLNMRNFALYLRSIAWICAVSAVIYIPVAYAGHTLLIGNRYWWFNSLHPNLGSEILAAGVICATLDLNFNWKKVAVVAVPCIWAILMMQGRACLLATVGALAMRGVIALRKRFNVSLGTAIALTIFVAVTVGGPIAIIEHAAIEEQVTEILLLDNAYRGVGTHLVGREGRWSNAIDIFERSPIFGAGPVFETGEVESPHNFWLYAFVEFGALSILFFGAFLSLAWKAARQRPESLLIASPFFIMSIFNDRFVDLNLYPFAGFVILVMLATPRERKTAARYSVRGTGEHATAIPLATI